MSGDPWASGAGGTGISDWHPVGSNVAISPAAIVAPTFKYFLQFAFIDRAFQFEVHGPICGHEHQWMLSLYPGPRNGLFYLSQIT